MAYASDHVVAQTAILERELDNRFEQHPDAKQRVVLARYARNRHLADTCHMWAFTELSASPGARAFYDERRAGGDTHNRALRALANRLVGLLHGCLRHGTLYDEHTAWAHRLTAAA